MNLKDKIIDLLDRYIYEYEQELERYEEKLTILSLYNELIDILENKEIHNHKLEITILLSAIYGNNSEYERMFYKCLYDEDIKNQFQNQLKIDMLEQVEGFSDLEEKVKQGKYLAIASNRIKTSFKFNVPFYIKKIDGKRMISDEQSAKRIIQYFANKGDITKKEELLYINEIEIHNRLITEQNSLEKNYTNHLYSRIPNILNMGFQQLDTVLIDDKNKTTLRNLSKQIYDHIIKDPNRIIDIFEEYKDAVMNEEEYKYVILKVLHFIEDNLIAAYELLLDENIYRNRFQRNIIIDDYYKELDVYIKLRKYYDNIMLEENVIKEEDITEEELGDTNEQKQLFFSTNSSGKAKVLSDMKDIPEEYYETVLYLINGFRNNTLSRSEMKILRNDKMMDKCIELRYDQIRVILKPIKNNIYAVLGLFVKKNNNDVRCYHSIANRDIPKINSEEGAELYRDYSLIIMNELEQLVMMQGRKGTR
ncbi:MAG: hypothetical protein PUA90_01725 [bacterium]|nr:hypothetical protein [bacterium]